MILIKTCALEQRLFLLQEIMLVSLSTGIRIAMLAAISYVGLWTTNSSFL